MNKIILVIIMSLVNTTWSMDLLDIRQDVTKKTMRDSEYEKRIHKLFGIKSSFESYKKVESDSMICAQIEEHVHSTTKLLDDDEKNDFDILSTLFGASIVKDPYKMHIMSEIVKGNSFTPHKTPFCIQHYPLDFDAVSNKSGKMLLHTFVGRAVSPAFIIFCISRMHNLNAKDGKGETLLLRACRANDKDAVTILLALGNNPGTECFPGNKPIELECVSKDGMTPLSIARTRGYKDIEGLLLEYGAKK